MTKSRRASYLEDSVVFASGDELDLVAEVPLSVAVADRRHRRRLVLILFVVLVDERVVLRELELFALGCKKKRLTSDSSPYLRYLCVV